MQPSGQQPVHRPMQPPEAETGALRAPASAVEAIMGRLGLARTQDEPDTDEETLSAHLADPSWAVRVSTVQKLGKMGRQAPLGLLLAAMHDEQRSVRVAAARALSRNPRQAAISALVAALEDSEWLVRAEAVLALGELHELAPLEPLLTALQDKDAAVRAAAAQALGTCTTTRVLSALKTALRDEDWSVREAAALALARLELEEPPTIVPLPSTPADADPLIREAAEAGLLQIYPPVISVPLPGGNEPSPWQKPGEYAQSTRLEHTTTRTRARQKSGRRAGPEIQEPRGVSASLNWPRKAMHTAGGVLAAALITGLFLAWLAIEAQPHPTQGQAGSNTTHAITFTVYRQHTSDVQNMAWSPDGQLLASADIRGTVLIWQANTGKTLMNYPQRNSVLALAWSNLTTLLVVCAEPNKALQVLTLTPGFQPGIQTIFQQTGLPGVPTIAAWSPDRQMLAFDNGDGSLQIWNMVSGVPITTISQKHAHYTQLAWSFDSSQLATISTTGVLQIWDTYTGLPISSLAGNYLATLVAWISCSRYQSGTLLIDSGNTLLEWSYGQKGEKITSFLTESAYNFANIDGLFISALAISPNGKQLLLATSDGLIQARDMPNGNLIYSYPGHTAQVNTIQWSPDKRHIASAGMDTTVQVWQET